MRARALTLSTLLFAAVAMVGVAAPTTAFACDDDSGVCVDGKGGKWKADGRLSKKARKKTTKKNRKKKKVTLTAEVEGGRGSVFIDGIYAGTNEITGAELRPGQHDIQVRDGSTLIAQGVLTISKKNSGTISLVFVHP